MDEVTCFAGLFERPFIVTNARRVCPLDKQPGQPPPVDSAPKPRIYYQHIDRLKRERQLLAYLRRNRGVTHTYRTMMQELDCAQSTLTHYLNKLKKLGFIQCVGLQGVYQHYSATHKTGDIPDTSSNAAVV